MDVAAAVALDAAGAAYIVGTTASGEESFPDGDGFGALPRPDHTFNGGNDAFVVQVKADGSALGWATYIGGSEDEDGAGIAVDAAGTVRVVAAAESDETSFPDGDGIGALPGPDRTHNGNRDAFVVAIGPGLAPGARYLPLALHP